MGEQTPVNQREDGREDGKGWGRPGVLYAVAAAITIAVVLALASLLLSGSREDGPGARPQERLDRARGVNADEIILTDRGPALRLRRRTFVWKLRSRGKLEPLDESNINVQTWGVITRIWEDGAPVKKGDVVLELDRNDMERRIADREAEVVVRGADLVQTRLKQGKRVKSAEMAARRAEYDLRWESLGREILLLGASTEELARARKELETRELVERNRAEELAIVQDLAAQGYATTGEVERKRLQLAEAKLEAEKARIAHKRLTDGPTVLEKREAELEVKIAEYAQESARKRVGSAQAASRGAVANAEKDLARETHDLDHDKEELEKYTIKSPADGYILYASGRWGGAWAPGRRVWRGAKVMSIPSEGRVKVKTKIGHAELGTISEDLPCLVTVAAKTGASPAARPYRGKVLSVSSQGQDEYEDLDSFTKQKVAKSGRKTFNVEVELLNEDPSLKPGFRAEVEFLLGEVKGALVVPWGAVGPLRADGGRYVTLVTGGRLERRRVEIGQSDETDVVIESGCEEGDVVLLAYAGR